MCNFFLTKGVNWIQSNQFGIQLNNRVRGIVKLNRVIPTYLYAGRNVDSMVLSRVESVNEAANQYLDLEKNIENFQKQFYLLFIAINLPLSKQPARRCDVQRCSDTPWDSTPAQSSAETCRGRPSRAPTASRRSSTSGSSRCGRGRTAASTLSRTSARRRPCHAGARAAARAACTNPGEP